MAATAAVAERRQFRTFVVKTRDGDDCRFHVDSFYRHGQFIGSGYGSVVAACLDTRTNEWVAIKRMRVISDEDISFARTATRELEFLRTLNHPHLVQYHDVIEPEDGQPDVVYLVMKFVSKTLYRVIGHHQHMFTPVGCKHFAYQLLLGLDHMHTRGVAHRDLKPQNVLCDVKTPSLRICDMGMARALPNVAVHNYNDCSDYVTTVWYRAPEVALAGPYGMAVDIWSLGCILYEMMTKRPPLMAPAEKSRDLVTKCFSLIGSPSSTTLYKICCDEEWKFARGLPYFPPTSWAKPIQDAHGDDAARLVRRMLTIDPDNRITARQALAHPYFDDVRSRYPSNTNYSQATIHPEPTRRKTVGQWRETVWKSIAKARPDTRERCEAWLHAQDVDKRCPKHTFDDMFRAMCVEFQPFCGGKFMLWRISLRAPAPNSRRWTFGLATHPTTATTGSGLTWQQRLFAEHALVMSSETLARCSQNAEHMKTLRVRAWCACVLLQSKLVEGYTGTLALSCHTLAVEPALFTLIAEYASDIPFPIHHTTGAVTPAVTIHPPAKRQRLS